MKRCEACHNEYDKTFEVVLEGKSHVFDSFECAINRLAPRCAHCGNIVMGHGVEVADTVYCCANCARGEGEHGIKDRQETSPISGVA